MLNTPPAAHTRIGRFLAGGSAAAALHFAVVVTLVAQFGLPALWANVAGWGVAFGLSFAGHARWTFRDQGAPLRRSALRFFAVSAAGFAVNECAYALLLHWSGLGYATALAAVLLGVALFTYLLGRHWAFQGKPTR